MDRLTSPKCAYCEGENNQFVLFNVSGEYSGIEMALNPQGMFRVRVLDSCDSFTTQDIVTIKYCPMCGRKFRMDK